MSWGALSVAVSRATPPAPAPDPVAAFADPTPGDRLVQLLTASQVSRVTRRVGLTIPAMRKGHAAITKQPATWPLRWWQGEQLAAVQPAWLAAPDPACTWLDLVAPTLDDALWLDRAYWRVTRRGADGYPLAFRRIPADDVTEDPTTGALYVNGKTPREAFPEDPGPVILSDGRILEHVLRFHWHGLGGLARTGSVIVDLALDLLGAAGNYARSPLPSTILTPDPSMGALTDAEIETLLAGYEAKRAARATAYLEGVNAQHTGFSAKELQLVEAREHSALEIARSLSLPAWAVEASNGASLQYSTTVENRRDLVEALRLWTAPIEQTLSLHAAPRGISVRVDPTSYTRDDATTRMAVWASGIASGVLTVDEARRHEPLAGGA